MTEKEKKELIEMVKELEKIKYRHIQTLNNLIFRCIRLLTVV